MSLFDEYTPTDLEDEVFLSKLPVGIIEDCIRSQFEEPYEYRKRDYFETYMDKYNVTEEYGTEMDILEAEEAHDGFIVFMQELFQEFLHIGFDNLDEKSADDQIYMLQMTTRFFIRMVRKNFTNLIMNYLDKYPDIYLDLPDRKDVTYHNYKNEGISKDDIKILSNLNYVVTTVLEKDFDIDEFFDLVSSDDYSLERDYVRRQFDEFNITGNFVRPYIDMVSDESFIITLESRVKNKILKKYPNRKVVMVSDDDEKPVTNKDPDNTDLENAVDVEDE